MRFIIQTIMTGSICVFLMACTPKELKAPCNDYGQHCDPKVPINQWTPYP